LESKENKRKNEADLSAFRNYADLTATAVRVIDFVVDFGLRLSSVVVQDHHRS
jgi:hypothetical protein